MRQKGISIVTKYSRFYITEDGRPKWSKQGRRKKGGRNTLIDHLFMCMILSKQKNPSFPFSHSHFS